MKPLYTMPAEWAPHKRTWLAWPHAKADWPAKFAPVPWIFAEMIRGIAASERVGLLVKSTAAEAEAQEWQMDDLKTKLSGLLHRHEVL